MSGAAATGRSATPPVARAEPPVGELGLLLAALAELSAVVLFTWRDGADGGLPPSYDYLLVERSMFMAGMLLSAIAFCLLADRPTGRENQLLRAGALAYLAAGIVGVVAEAIDLANAEAYPLFVTYVLMAFIGQAVIGLGLGAARLVTPWVAWTTAAWNIVWPLVLSVVSPDDYYYPAVHIVMPLLIGLHMLRRRVPNAETSG